MAGQAGGDDAICIKVDALATDLENMFSNNITMSPQQYCIFRVPNVLREQNPRAYTPNTFSIGPFHCNKEHLKATQSIKLKFLRGLISRVSSTNLRALIEAISKLWKEASECYAGGTDMPEHEFVKVLVLDGCFLIELFRNIECDLGEDVAAIKVGSISQSLRHDLILLENQIPWMVLDRLFDMTKTPVDVVPLDILVLRFVYASIRPLETFDQKVFKSPNHILDLVRNSMVSLSSVKKDDKFNSKRMPSATSLQEAGIKFSKATSSTGFILDITFNDKSGVLEIPYQVIDDNTETLFRNLICLEQCLPNCDGIITSYAMRLDNLIDTAQDMEILCNNGVFENWMNIKESTEIFNQLCDNVEVNDWYYTKLTNDVNKYCRRRWPRYRAVLMRDYFNHPWSVISVFAAVVLLILTFLQTLYSIKG